ncbi:phage tail protein [Pedobacter sp. UYP1]|uniref:phage tail protein n=1 Tax=Pedobacter sp. UYP1 TaxID=1756396 RepID=UPI0033926BAB
MRYEIKRTSGSTEWLIASVSPTGKQSKKAMGENVVDFSFTLPKYIDFKLMDFVLVYGERYQLNVLPSVKKVAKNSFEYNMQLEAVFYDLAKVQLQFLNVQNQLLEPSFTLMGNAGTIVGLIVENANRHSAGWSVGTVDDTGYKNFTFNAENCLQGLNRLAQEFETEFWIDNKTIHLQKREQSSGMSFGYGQGKGLYSILRGNNKNINIVTRLYVRGSAQNLPAGYRNSSGNLLLPGGKTYFEDPAKVALYGLIEASQVFDIKPEREGVVTAVVPGNGNWKLFTDITLDFDINAVKLDIPSKVRFNTGQLAGYSFEITAYNHQTKQVTIKKNEEEKSIEMPSDLLRPAVGDKYILIDIAMPENYVLAAENRLNQASSTYYEKNSDPTLNFAYTIDCDPIWFKQLGVQVTLGNTVLITDTDMGINGEIRIAAYKRDLQSAFKYEFEVTDSIGANEIIRQYAQQQRTLQLIESSGLLDINQIRKNIFLNRLSEQDGYLMLSGTKTKAGVADYTPEAGHALKADYAPESGHALKADYAKDSDQWDGRHFDDFMNQPVRKTDAVTFLSVVADTVNSKGYVSGFTGTGYKINPDGSAEFDNLTVRKELNVNVLNIREITGSGGSIAITNVAKIKEVTEHADYWSCQINTDEGTIAVQFRVNDIVRCQVWDGKRIKYYTARVRAVSSGIFDLDKGGKTGGGMPAAGDSVFQFGNTSDSNRQGLIYLTNSDTGAPYIDVLDGINSDNLSGKTKVRLGKLSGISDADLGELDGYGLYADRAFIKGKIVVTGGNAATNQSVADKIGAIQIGGANLYSGGNFDKQPLLEGKYNCDPGLSSEYGGILPRLGNYFLLADNKGLNPIFYYQMPRINVVGNTQYTISFYSISPSAAKGLNIVLAYNGTDVQPTIPMTYTNTDFSWGKRNSLTISTPAEAKTMAIRFDINSASWFVLDGLQVEIGNKATDWKPSVEDLSKNVTDKIDAIKLGTRNLVLDGAFKDGLTGWYSNGGSTEAVIIDGLPALKIISAGMSNGVYSVGKLTVPIKAHTDYIVSFDVKGLDYTGGNYLSIGLNSVSNGIYVPDNPVWTRVSYVSNSGGISGNDPLVIYGTGARQAFFIRNLKIAEGNNGADWSPSPEDVSREANAYTELISTSKANAAQANALYGASLDAQAKANTAKDAAELTAKALIDSVSFGGVNMLKNSGNFTTTAYWSGSIVAGGFTDGSACLHSYDISLGDVFYLEPVRLKKGTVYTWSGWIYSVGWSGTINDVAPFHLWIGDSPNTTNWGYTILSANQSVAHQEWRFCYLTFKTSGVNDNGLLYMRPYIYGSGVIHEAYWAKVKLEESSKPTSWSPAPEDVQAAISNANDKAVSAQQANNDLTARLKTMAYRDIATAAAQGVTTIDNGSILTFSIDAAYIRSNVINVGYISGLDLNFTKGTIGGIVIQSNAITSANGLFSVTNAGLLIATNANISGNIAAYGGSIGGILIQNNAITSANGLFSVTSAGALTATNANISGTVSATAGSIGGILIQDNAITSANGLFSVTSAGVLTAANANISGTINVNAGIIGGFNIRDSYMESATNSDGNRFALNPSGGYMAFINNTNGSFAGIGNNVFSATVGATAVARFENNKSSPGGLNIGLRVSATGASSNIAIDIGDGDIRVAGEIGLTGYCRLSDYANPNTGNYWGFKVTKGIIVRAGQFNRFTNAPMN